jgi:hypothetical protein
MNIVVLKSEEDSLLADCDNSCANNELCVCKTILGMENAGQGMYNYGIHKCVLCCRNEAVDPIYPYRVVVDGYPRRWVRGGVFIRFDPVDYENDGKRNIKQITKNDGELCPETWVSKIYDTVVVTIPERSTRWFLTICETEGCRSPIHSYIDEHRAIGIMDSYVDLTTNAVLCKKCEGGLVFIHDSDGVVRYKGVSYSRCRFCFTIVPYKCANAIQICTTCLNEREKELKNLERVCFYCRNAVPVNKRGGSQTLSVKQPNGTVEDIFLCRHHKVKNYKEGRVVDATYISNLFSL